MIWEITSYIWWANVLKVDMFAVRVMPKKEVYQMFAMGVAWRLMHMNDSEITTRTASGNCGFLSANS
jgi:hypothetical protein